MVAFQKPHNEEGGTGRINFSFLSCLGVIRGSTGSGGRKVFEGKSPRDPALRVVGFTRF